MTITAVETHHAGSARGSYVFVKVLTSDGIAGWGEASLEGKERTVMQAVAELARYLVGQDPFRIEQHWQQMYRGAYWVGGPVLNSAISGIEQALWDIKGKALGVPAYELLGGKCRDRLRAYANGWFRGAETPADFARMAVATVERGYTALKWDPFGKAGLFPTGEEADRAVACVRAVREAVGPAIDLLIEVHGRFAPASAIRLARRLEEFDPFWYEEPVPPDNIDAVALVARSIGIPVATGERLFTKWGFKDVVEKQAAAVIQPDLCHAGGLLEVKKIAAMAETYYIGVAPHNPYGLLSTAACLQVDACTPNFLIQEFVVDQAPLWAGPAPFRVVDGYFTIPDGPGLGVTLDESLLDREDLTPHDMYQMIAPS